MVLLRTDLHTIAVGKMLAFVMQGAQVFQSSLRARTPVGVCQPPGDRLEVDVVLENHAGQALEPSGVLHQRCVFELQNVNAVQINLAMDQPLEVGIGKLADRMRRNGSSAGWRSNRPYRKFDRGAKGA